MALIRWLLSKIKGTEFDAPCPICPACRGTGKVSGERCKVCG